MPSVHCAKLRRKPHPEPTEPENVLHIPVTSSASAAASTAAAAKAVLAEQGTGIMAVDIGFYLSDLENIAIK